MRRLRGSHGSLPSQHGLEHPQARIKLPWKCEDEIVVQREHVLETCDPTDMTFAGLLAASRSVPEAAVRW